MERLFEFAGNHPFLVSLFFALLILLILNLATSMAGGLERLVPSDLTRLINREHAMVVDVRNEDEFKSGHILNAINIPEPDLEDRKKELEKARKKPIVLYCQNGTVAPRALKRLKGQGFEKLYCLSGGLTSWQSAGLPVVRNGG